MAQSGSYDFTVSRDNLITDSLMRIGVLGEGESASANQLTESARILNMIVKFRAADGMPTWALRRGYVLPVTGVSSINTNSHIVTAYDTTTLSAAAASGATSLTVTSITGFTNGDQIGIELTNGDMDWTTINGVPSGTTIVITTGLTSAAASGLRIYGYTASSERIQKPLRILNANILQSSDNISWEIEVMTQQDYFNLGNRTSEGTPTGIYYTIEPSSLTALETNGKVFVYPRFADGKKVIEFTYHRPFQDFDAAGDDPDFPQAFFLPIMIELAAHLGPKYGVPVTERQSLLKEAQIYWELALASIIEEGSIRLIPDATNS